MLLTAGGAGLWLAGGVVAAGAAAAAGMFGGENPQALVRTGMQKFRKVRAQPWLTAGNVVGGGLPASGVTMFAACPTNRQQLQL